MRKWLTIALIALAIGWFILTNIGNAMAMSDLAGRPILALTRETTRVQVQSPGMQPETGEARVLGGTGIMFGVALRFALPDSSVVTCRQRFLSQSCDLGWQPERKPSD